MCVTEGNGMNVKARRGLWELVGPVALVLAVLQQLWSSIDARRYSPPGRKIDVGGYRLHVLVRGEEHDGPTVVLEAGMGSFCSNWHWVQEDLADSVRVVAYDRAGLGWSDPSPHRRDAKQIAMELHTALHAAGIPGPFVLAGHSFGGLPVRMFRELYPDEVAGLVLVDASHPDQWVRWPLRGADLILAGSQWLQAPLAALGLFRVVNVSGGISEGLPARQVRELRAKSALARTALTEARQMMAWRTSSRQQVNAAQRLGALPLFVLGVTEQPMGGEVLSELQEELQGLSGNSVRHVVDGATHESLVGHQGSAEVVARAIRNVLQAASTQQPLRAL
jgi:pimeloyl-ACP methyl ester carboxylesterase